jgi:hypothetical protein
MRIWATRPYLGGYRYSTLRELSNFGNAQIVLIRMKGLLARTALTAAALVFLTFHSGAADYAQWTNGPSSDPSYFPIAVWLQNPNSAERYKAAGINL